MERTKLVSAMALLLVGTMACAGQDSSSDGQDEAIERIEYVSADIPEDRADDAVNAALGRIDPCSLIDPGGVGVPYLAGGDVEARSPHTCHVSNGVVQVSVRIGAEFSAEDRYNAIPETLGGAKAYVVSTSDLGMCQVALPVDFAHSIMFVGSYSSSQNRDSCDNAKAFARTAAKRLEQPDEIAYDDEATTRTACDILRPAVDIADNQELRSGWNFEYGIDECGLWAKSGEGGLQAVEPEVGLSVEFRDSIPDYYKPAGTVRGRELRAFECTMSWIEPGVHKPKGSANAVFSVSAPSCKNAKNAVGDIADVIDDDRIAKPAEPQTPVLYAPDEPDVAAAGACVDVLDAASLECQPYEETDAPTDGDETIAAASADPNVACAIAADAVEKHFDEDLHPVTAARGVGPLESAGRMCGFVEESHALQLWIGASRESIFEPPTSKIGGYPAHDETTSSLGERTMWVALDDDGESGYLYAEVVVKQSREDGNLDGSAVDTAPLQKLDEVMTDVVADHFNA